MYPHWDISSKSLCRGARKRPKKGSKRVLLTTNTTAQQSASPMNSLLVENVTNEDSKGRIENGLKVQDVEPTATSDLCSEQELHLMRELATHARWDMDNHIRSSALRAKRVVQKEP